jgi:hypothetical protein
VEIKFDEVLILEKSNLLADLRAWNKLFRVVFDLA